MNVQIQNLYSGSYHLLDDADNDAMLLRSAVTLNSGDFKSTGWLPLSFITDTPGGKTGVGDLALFDPLVFNKS